MTDKILVVDDDTDGLKLIGLMLQRQGYEVITASNGSQALAKAASERPDLVILDVMMPDMDGYEVCRRLRANSATSNMPIIMFTAKTLIDDKAAGFEAGADDYLTKPTHPTELASRIKATLLKRRGERSDMEKATNHGMVTAPPPAEKTEQKPRHVLTIGVMGTSGGLGTTTVALNLAATLQNDGMNAIVADLEPGNGSLAFFLGQRNGGGLATVFSHPTQEITPQLLEAALINHESGLRALSSSTNPSEGVARYGLDQVVAIIRGLRMISDAVVIDLGSRFNPIIGQLHARLDHLVLLVEPDLASVAIANGMLRELEKEKPGRVNVIVASRLKHNYQPAWQDVEHALSHDIRGIISPAPEVAYEAMEAGIPVVNLKPESVLANQIASLAHVLIHPDSAS